MAIDGILQCIAPETAALTPEKRASLIEIATLQIPSTCRRNVRDLAIAYLAAHISSIASRGGAAMSVVSEREGDLSRSYGSSSSGGMESTSYGQEFIRITRSCTFLPLTRVRPR